MTGIPFTEKDQTNALLKAYLDLFKLSFSESIPRYSHARNLCMSLAKDFARNGVTENVSDFAEKILRSLRYFPVQKP